MCNSEGHLDDTNFSKPMPWIGIYIAAASLLCLISMSADLIKGIKTRKLWFPCKYFCLNATSLTIIAVSVKLSVDLNTPMPHRHDQLAKLASSAIICTIMANSMPSLGVTQNNETMMNVLAMAILVITMIVNICIQFGTGVIYEFWIEHGVIMFLMVVLLMIMTSSTLCLQKIKHYMELKYKINEEALREESNSKEKQQEFEKVTDRLRDELMKFWMMAHTSSPQFILGRSVSCTASGAFCILSTLTLIEAMLRSYLMSWTVKFCTGECDYKWSTILILIVQVAAVGVGTIAPALRWFVAVRYRCPNVRKRSCKRIFQVEGYWTDRLVVIRESPISFRIRNQWFRKLAHDVKQMLLCLCIKLQIGMVILCKAVQYVSVYPMCWILGFCEFCRTWKFSSSASSLGSSTKQDLRRYILHLEGEEELVEVMMKDNWDATIHWVEQGEKKQPKLVIELLEKKCSILQGFKGVGEFDCDQILPLHGVEPPYNWSLPIVTLASIIVALPNIEKCLVKKLISTLNEALPYVKFIENNIDKDGEFIKARKTAEIVWLGTDLYRKWLDVDLYKLSLQNKSIKETLETLAEIAKTRYEKYKAKYHHVCIKVSPSAWPIKVLASNAMYRISKTILLLNQDVIKGHTTSEMLFEAVTVIIADILGACLTNLPYVISVTCLNTGIEERENSVRQAVYVLGKTKKIIEMLENRTFPRVDFCRGTNIEDWRLIHKQKRFCCSSVPSSLKENTPPTKLRDLCLNIES